MYEYAEMTVWFSEEGYPREQAERLLVRRTLNQDGELKYHRSNAPPKVTLQRVAEQRGCRWSIEEDIKASKGQCGLDEYETRGWIGWHHHTGVIDVGSPLPGSAKAAIGKKNPTDVGSGSSRDFFVTYSICANGTRTKSLNGAIGEWIVIASPRNAIRQGVAKN